MSAYTQSTPRKLLVAVDFGTTFSALAWADTRRKKSNTITDWPDGNSTDSKVPTVLQYETFDLPQGGSHTWGFEAVKHRVSTHITYEMFKLGLDPQREKETQLSRDYPSVARLPSDPAVVEKLVTDYLRRLRKHFHSQLDDLPASTALQEVLKRYIITVPAMWSPAAQDQTRRCAEAAKMGENVTIISEPEAAAIKVLDEMRSDDRLKVGETFVLCDAGGGTVDLITYTVTGFRPLPNSKDVLEVKETVKGAGYVCGGIFVNRVFAKHMRETYGFTGDLLNRAVREFEEKIKTSFAGKLNKTYTMPVGVQNAAPNIRGGILSLTGLEIKGFFDPVITEIERLVNAQIDSADETVKCVILVGGLGGNKYLKERLEKAVGPGIKISKPHNHQTAVVEGALIRALLDEQPGHARIRIHSRIARQYYGSEVWVPFQRGVHDPTKIILRHGKEEVSILRWLAVQGKEVDDGDMFPFSWDMKAPGTIEEIRMPIYSYEAPTNRTPPLYPLSNGITRVGELRVRPNDLPPAAIRTEDRRADGHWNIVDFDIQLTLHSATIMFALIVKNVRCHELPIDFTT